MEPTTPLDRPVGRRTFLAGAGLALAAACSDGGGDSSSGADGAEVRGAVATGDVYAGTPLRFPFGVERRAEVGYAEVHGVPASLGFTSEGRPAIPPRNAVWHATGLAGQEHEGIYTVEVEFPAAGVWDARLDIAGREASFPVQVNAEPLNPVPGDAAVSAASPTGDDTLGVDPICTRTPACPLHDVSLDTALAGDKPVVLIFSTPARCTSRWCGPVLEVLLTVVDEFRSDVDAVHVEIFKDLSSNEPVPTVAAWNLATEPILYGIDAEGTIRSRIDGAFDADEARALLEGLA